MSQPENHWRQLAAEEVAVLAPDAVMAFHRMIAAVVATQSPALELVRRRVAMILQLPADGLPSVADLDDPRASLLPSWPIAEVYSGGERVRLSFAEQFVMDVSGVTADDRGALTNALGGEVFGFVQALYVLDHGARLSNVLGVLFGASPLSVESPPATVADLWPATEAMMAAVARLGAVDPLTAELIRLRGARVHQCRLCCSRRRVSAIAANAPLLETTDLDPADLTPAQHAALALADALLLRPGDLPAGLIDEVQSQYAPHQAIEIALLVAHNAANKIAVALGADAPVVTDGVEYFEVDGTGEYRYGLVAPS